MRLLPLWLTLTCVLTAAAPARAEGDVRTAFTKRVAQKYGRLGFMLENPDRFVDTMRARFAARKATHPHSPHHFDFSEIGIPLVTDLRRDLETKRAAIAARPAKSKKARDEIASATAHFKDLLAESDTYLRDEKITYRQLIELSYFATRAMGHFDARDDSLRHKLHLAIDRHINGYRELSIDEERALYRGRRFRTFQTRSWSPTMRRAEFAFERAFLNPDHLQSIWIPTNVSLGRDVLLRLIPKNIELVGVTPNPIMADGIHRPSGDFWAHDVRHSSSKMQKRRQYLTRNRVLPSRRIALDELSEKWLAELETERAAIEDKDLKKAVGLVAFNFHHERGFVLAPSEYLYPGRNRTRVAKTLYTMQKTGGEGVGFGEPRKNFARADAWLEAFWKARAEEERAFLGAPRALPPATASASP